MWKMKEKCSTHSSTTFKNMKWQKNRVMKQQRMAKRNIIFN